MIDKDTVIKKLRSIHGDKYILDEVTDIKNVNERIKVTCLKHNYTWMPTFHNMYYGKRGCKFCGRERTVESVKLTKDEFIDRSSKTHKNIDNYDFVNLNLEERDELGRIRIHCKKHGDFLIRPIHFINGVGCQKCSGAIKDDEEVKKELSKIHPELDFSITKFSEHDEKYRIDVICHKHGIRHLNYYNLKYGQGCDICRYDKISDKKRIKIDEFIKRANKVHGNGTYIYSDDILENRTENGKITPECPIHGKFSVTLYNFLNHHSGCPICNQSHLESEVRISLENIGVKPECGKTFEWLKYENFLHLDLYIKDYNVAIECQGLQHFQPVDIFDGIEGFKKTIMRDKIKRELCEKHGVRLLYFSHENIDYPYKVFTNVNELIKEALKK